MQSIGIDLDSDIINFSIMNKNKDLINIKSLDLNDIQNDDVKKLYISNKDKFLITSALDESDVMIKSSDCNIKKSFTIKKAIKLHERSISNLDIEKIIIDTIYLKNTSELKFFITTKKLLNKHLDKLKHINIDPDRVTTTSQALIRFINHYFQDIKNAFLIHIAKSKTICIFMKANQPQKTFSIKIGTKKLIKAMEDDKIVKNSKIDVLNLSIKGKLYTTLNQLKKEIEKVFVYFCKSEKEKHPMLVTGDINFFFHICEFLKNDKVNKILKNSFLEKKTEYKKFAICIGLSLDAFKKDGLSLQFRKNEFTSPKKIKTIGKKSLFLTLIVLVFTLLIHFGSNHLLSKKEKILQQRLKFIKESENRYLDIHKNETSQNFYDDLNAFEKKLAKENQNFPYILKVPNVSETLDWLNNHECLKDAEITSINYTLEKFPTIFSKNEIYLAKIDIEFKTKKPTIARSFYDSITTPNCFVNSNHKISWKAKGDTYKATFYLKNTK